MYIICVCMPTPLSPADDGRARGRQGRQRDVRRYVGKRCASLRLSGEVYIYVYRCVHTYMYAYIFGPKTKIKNLRVACHRTASMVPFACHIYIHVCV